MFIEFTHAEAKVRFLVGTDHIVAVGPADVDKLDGPCEVRVLHRTYIVTESYDEVKRLLEYVAKCQSS